MTKIIRDKKKKFNLTKWIDNLFIPFVMWTIPVIMTINKNKEGVERKEFLFIFVLFIFIVIISPLFSDLILFIYQRILEAKYRKLRKERQRLEKELKRLKMKSASH
ncbi:MAG: hypothetical protein GBAus27B_000450 [Mycoplasmataceae bacterium]|nr:MAG: hypothetical protein GBAus27B_000450 [Mycoplasmataceae bacterium]